MRDVKNSVLLNNFVNKIIDEKKFNRIIKSQEQKMIILRLIIFLLVVYIIFPIILGEIVWLFKFNISILSIFEIYYLVSIVFMIVVFRVIYKCNYVKKEIKGFNKSLEMLNRLKNNMDGMSVNKIRKQVGIVEEIGSNPRKYLRFSKKGFLENALYKELYNESDIAYVYSLLAEYILDKNKKILD